MHHLKLSFFGRLQVSLDEKPVTNFRSAKTKGLLVFLTLNGQQAFSRQRLAALLWPNEPDKVARRNLRQIFFRLRQSIGDSDDHDQPFFLSTRSTIQFNQKSNYTLDVEAFLSCLESGRLSNAVEIYTGELLPGFNCDTLPFDEWLRGEQERLSRLGLKTLFEQAQNDLSEGSDARAQDLARRQLAIEPWREEAHRQLMQALASQGERSAAIAQYELCRKTLEAELGVLPSAETETLLNQIRSQTRPIGPANRQQADRAKSRQLFIPFISRQHEFKGLRNAHQQLGHSGFQAVVLRGVAGIGKSRLAEQFLNWAATQGGDILRSRVYETGGGLSYQPLIQLWRQRLERENAPEDLLSDLWLSQLTRLLPELRDRYPDLPQPTQEAPLARQHLFEAVTRLGRSMAARQPLILFIDDWHWADAASLDLLDYATRSWLESGTPILLLLTFREEALSGSIDMQNWLAVFKRDIQPAELHLGPFTNAETELLVNRLLAPEKSDGDGHSSVQQKSDLDRFNRWLFKETDGQPLFLTETLKSLVAQGLIQVERSGQAWEVNWSTLNELDLEVKQHISPGIQAIIRRWLSRISPNANKLLTAASVLLHDASFRLLCYVSDLKEEAALDALDNLLSKQLLIEAAPSETHMGADLLYAFSHQKVSDIVYREAGQARQRLLHRRAFETLQRDGQLAADLAQHAQQAGLLLETIRYSLIAGSDALNMLSAQIAVGHYETAFRSAEQRGWPEAFSGADRQALYTGLGRAYELCEQAEEARGVYERMVAYAHGIGATSMVCQGLNRLAALYNMPLLDPEKAFAILEEAWTIAEEAGDRRGMAETAQNLAAAAGVTLDLDNEIRYAEQALTLARELEHPQLLAHCLSRFAYAYAKLRDWERCERYAAEATRQFEALGNFMLANHDQRLLGACQMQNGRAQEGLDTLKNAHAFIQQVENDWEQSEVGRFLAQVYVELGQYGQAIQLVREAVNQARQANHPMITVPLANYGTIYRFVFALDEAQGAWQAIVEATANGGFDPFPDLTQAGLCAIHALRGEWDVAHGHAKNVLAFHEGGSLPPMGLTGWFETEALLRGGSRDLARAELLRASKAIGNNRRYQLPLLRSQAVLAQWDGRVAQAIDHLEGALALAREMGLPGEEWPILGELGKLYAENGEPAKSKEAYQEAAPIIHKLADTIEDEALREGFLTADLIRSVLEIVETE